jgi:hypothetical protein
VGNACCTHERDKTCLENVVSMFVKRECGKHYSRDTFIRTCYSTSRLVCITNGWNYVIASVRIDSWIYVLVFCSVTRLNLENVACLWICSFLYICNTTEHHPFRPYTENTSRSSLPWSMNRAYMSRIWPSVSPDFNTLGFYSWGHSELSGVLA